MKGGSSLSDISSPNWSDGGIRMLTVKNLRYHSLAPFLTVDVASK